MARIKLKGKVTAGKSSDDKPKGKRLYRPKAKLNVHIHDGRK